MSPTSFQTAPPRDMKLTLKKEKADDRTRTDNLLITNQLLCQLSHIGLHLQVRLKIGMDGGGFEPPKQFAADLQSVPFGHSGIHPYVKNIKLLYLLG